jgi:hypothetical protein
MATTATVRLVGGAMLTEAADTETPERDLPRQGERLAAKFRGLAAPVLGPERTAELLAAVAELEGVSSIATIAGLSGGADY